MIRVDYLDRLALFLPVHRVVAVNERKIDLSGRDEISAFAITGGYLHAILFHVVHERLGAVVAPDREKSGDIIGGCSKQRIRDGRAPIR